MSVEFNIPTHPSTFRAIVLEVCEKHMLLPREVLSAYKGKNVVACRAEIAYRAYQNKRWSLLQIARFLGRDHSTIHNAIAAHKTGLYDEYVSMGSFLAERECFYVEELQFWLMEHFPSTEPASIVAARCLARWQKDKMVSYRRRVKGWKILSLEERQERMKHRKNRKGKTNAAN